MFGSFYGSSRLCLLGYCAKRNNSHFSALHIIFIQQVQLTLTLLFAGEPLLAAIYAIKLGRPKTSLGTIQSTLT